MFGITGIITVVTLCIANGDCLNIVRRRADYCIDRECTSNQPTCSVKFRPNFATSNFPVCLNARQIVPVNASVKTIFARNYPVLLHTKFKNLVYEIKVSINAWIRTKIYSQNVHVVNIAVNNVTRVHCFGLRSEISKWYHLVIPAGTIIAVIIKKRCKTAAVYNNIELDNFRFTQNDERPILENCTV